ncbi:hypothetical protein [Salininema proteolyticum]|uniref:SH3 domain-containing protein n=1 Tax=Salininema proteolyticum TaxID=1607685 RepID=A0ABV8TX85_9ACTN
MSHSQKRHRIAAGVGGLLIAAFGLTASATAVPAAVPAAPPPEASADRVPEASGRCEHGKDNWTKYGIRRTTRQGAKLRSGYYGREDVVKVLNRDKVIKYSYYCTNKHGNRWYKVSWRNQWVVQAGLK